MKLNKQDPAFWVRDEMVTTCLGCAAPFDSVNRKHHCRLCGNVFCGDCTIQKLNYPLFDLKNERGCNACYQYITLDLSILSRETSFIQYTETEKFRVTLSISSDHTSLAVRPSGTSNTTSAEKQVLLTSRLAPPSVYNLSGFINIVQGQNTPIFKKHHPSFFARCLGGEDIRVYSPNSFSLLFNQGSIDLQADSTDVKKQWVDAWTEFQRRQSTDAGKHFTHWAKVKSEQEKEKEIQGKRMAQEERRQQKESNRQKTAAIRDKYNIKKGY
eukprot:TRINITY_DN10328_c0_g1_i1.p1 TRINITY_DN10328_c0_g1~~TRINITY_DN10328_c0_g1_i1.p1  ORF type:complete len:270 (-),score=57.13 TRINITY_DN10328_c0_g1_i1:15-824(-)